MGGQTLTRGALTGSVPPLRELYLEEGYAATRWQWVPFKVQNARLSTWEESWVRFRDSENFFLTPWPVGSMSRAEDFTSACEDIFSSITNSRSGCDNSSNISYSHRTLGCRLYMDYLILSPNNPIQAGAIFIRWEDCGLEILTICSVLDGWQVTELSWRAAEPPLIFPSLFTFLPETYQGQLRAGLLPQCFVLLIYLSCNLCLLLRVCNVTEL